MTVDNWGWADFILKKNKILHAVKKDTGLENKEDEYLTMVTKQKTFLKTLNPKYSDDKLNTWASQNPFPCNRFSFHFTIKRLY